MQLENEPFGATYENQMEALAWLRQEEGKANHAITGLDAAKSLAVVEELYQLGAEQVLAIGIRKEGEAEKSDALVIKLPEDPAIRQELFDWEASQAQGRGGESQTDHGQQLLTSSWGS